MTLWHELPIASEEMLPGSQLCLDDRLGCGFLTFEVLVGVAVVGAAGARVPGWLIGALRYVVHRPGPDERREDEVRYADT